ncbi:MAG: HD-GYP domain-containing protein [Solirubrobacteraceae bacterium]
MTARLAEKDPYTAGHNRRVARRAVQVAEALGLPPAVLRAVAIGGLLHDIGKLSTPDAILNKPGALDADEYAIIRRHPEDGEQLIRCLGGFSPQVLRLVRNHHERLDGRGYPHGLTGDQLDLPTRVLSVCDVYDALISNRAYRQAWSQERALERLRAEIGGAFDRRCVAALHHVAQDERPRPAVEMAGGRSHHHARAAPRHTA